MDPSAKKKPDFTQWQALEIVWDLLFSIAVPTVLFALLGRWLDKRYGTSPWFVGIGLVLALGVSAVIVTKKGRIIAKKL